MLILLYVAFCTIMAISRQKEARSQTMPYSYRMDSRVPYSAQYHRQHCILQAFKQFGALYMHNPDDKYPTRPGFEPSTSEFQATTESNEPSGRPTAKDTRLSNAMAWALVQWLNLPA